MPLPTAALAAALSSAALAGPAVADAAPAANNPVADWNRTALAILRTPGAQPTTVHPTRSLALLHAAIYDAVVSIDHSAPPYRVSVDAPRRASRPAAADAAAATVLDALFPSMSASTDAQEQSELSALGGGDRVRAGVQAGRAVAERLLALRAGDGSDAKPPAYVTTGLPGDFAPVPPGFAAPVFTHWGAVTPFVLRSGDELRPDAPPAVGSAAYARALREVQSLGSATSTTRTDDQTDIARFWAAPIQNYWNEIAQTAVTATHARLDTSARAFALLDLAQADATIAFYDAKYAYRVWRPVTAIRATSDRGWTPLATTPADPSYPGAHSVVSAASAAVLRSIFGDDLPITVTSEVLPGAQRTFPNFSAIVTEAGLSRVYAGVHTRLDHEAGLGPGPDVAHGGLPGGGGGGPPRPRAASPPARAGPPARPGPP